MRGRFGGLSVCFPPKDFRAKIVSTQAGCSRPLARRRHYDYPIPKVMVDACVDCGKSLLEGILRHLLVYVSFTAVPGIYLIRCEASDVDVVVCDSPASFVHLPGSRFASVVCIRTLGLLALVGDCV